MTFIVLPQLAWQPACVAASSFIQKEKGNRFVRSFNVVIYFFHGFIKGDPDPEKEIWVPSQRAVDFDRVFIRTMFLKIACTIT